MRQDERFWLICHAIETCLEKGNREFVIYPFGVNGMMVKQILNQRYNIQEYLIIDNKLSKYRSDVCSWEGLLNKKIGNFWILVTVENPKAYEEIAIAIEKCALGGDSFVWIFPAPSPDLRPKFTTNVGKYSYGPLAMGNHPLIERVGAFCSFAAGVTVVANHNVDLLTMHPILMHGNTIWQRLSNPPLTYDMYKGKPEYFPGIHPKAFVPEERRITIGNDVWLGYNTIITNYSDIGDGVIAGAGSVITKDVPDYAIVAGVPAKIVRYRFSPEQIKALKEIAWWDWPDEKIRENFDDFFLGVDDFIGKYR